MKKLFTKLFHQILKVAGKIRGFGNTSHVFLKYGDFENIIPIPRYVARSCILYQSYKISRSTLLTGYDVIAILQVMIKASYSDNGKTLQHSYLTTVKCAERETFMSLNAFSTMHSLILRRIEQMKSSNENCIPELLNFANR